MSEKKKTYPSAAEGAWLDSIPNMEVLFPPQ